jgi:anti-sigma regulatory factor (Ser/Thr protein kinase)
MKAMAPTRPLASRQCRLRLPATAVAPGLARGEVSEIIRAWGIDVDGEAAVLLTSELVTNAVLHDGAGTIVLTMSCRDGRFRVDVHDASPHPPVAARSAEPDAETGRGLMLVDSIADEWGYYPTAAGKGVFFTLAAAPGRTGASGPGA